MERKLWEALYPFLTEADKAISAGNVRISPGATGYASALRPGATGYASVFILGDGSFV